jgi:hypothetical protein
MDSNNLSRRDFLKETGKLALGGAAAAVYLKSFSGCASFPKETREDVAKIKWDCNPILPIPKIGCYTGTNKQGQFISGFYKKRSDGTFELRTTAVPIAKRDNEVVDFFKKHYGILPTFHASGSGSYSAFNHYFPIEECSVARSRGVIPVIRYVIMPFEGYRPIIQGKHDDQLKKFAAQAAEYEDPVVVLPFQQPNGGNKRSHPWTGTHTGGYYKEVFVRQRELSVREGATNIVWSVKLLIGSFDAWTYPDPFAYIPPKEYVDIIGWLANNLCRPQDGANSLSFQKLLEPYYNKAVEKYREVPQVLWEIMSNRHCNQVEQHLWMDNALTLIQERYFWIKGVNLDENDYVGHGFDVYPVPSLKTMDVIRKHFADPYFIENILPAKG